MDGRNPQSPCRCEALPPLLNARLIRPMEMVENIGLERMRESHVKHIEGKIWEMKP
jgi:hypothetical protein